MVILGANTDLRLTNQTASTFVYCDANKNLSSLSNSAGFVHNNGSGTFSYTAQIWKASGNDVINLNTGNIGIDHADPQYLLCVGDDNASDYNSNGQLSTMMTSSQ